MTLTISGNFVEMTTTKKQQVLQQNKIKQLDRNKTSDSYVDPLVTVLGYLPDCLAVNRLNNFLYMENIAKCYLMISSVFVYKNLSMIA